MRDVVETESRRSLFSQRERPKTTRRAELFVLCSILFHLILLTIFSLWTINTAAKTDKPLVVELAQDKDKDRYEFNDFPQDNETKEDVDSNRLSDKNRKVDRETIRLGTPLGGGSSTPPMVSPPPIPKIDESTKNDKPDKSNDRDKLVAKRETPSELNKKKEETTPRSSKERLTVEDLIPGSNNSARLNQPFGTNSPGVTEEESVSLNTTEFKYYAYFAHIKKQIELSWNYPLEAQKRNLGGRLTIVFIIESGGNVSSIKLLKSSGYEILDEYAINAVRIASPFNPIPTSIGTKRLKITASFEYITSLFGVRW